MPNKSNHVIHTNSSGWVVKKSGASRASRNFTTKVEAISYGISISKNEKAILYIHNSDGTIQNRNFYGAEPMPPRNRN